MRIWSRARSSRGNAPTRWVCRHQFAKGNGHGSAVADHQYRFVVAVRRADVFQTLPHALAYRRDGLAIGWCPAGVFV